MFSHFFRGLYEAAGRALATLVRFSLASGGEAALRGERLRGAEGDPSLRGLAAPVGGPHRCSPARDTAFRGAFCAFGASVGRIAGLRDGWLSLFGWTPLSKTK